MSHGGGTSWNVMECKGRKRNVSGFVTGRQRRGIWGWVGEIVKRSMRVGMGEGDCEGKHGGDGGGEHREGKHRDWSGCRYRGDEDGKHRGGGGGGRGAIGLGLGAGRVGGGAASGGGGGGGGGGGEGQLGGGGGGDGKG